MAVTKDNTDLGRGGTLLGQLADLLNNLLGGGLEPRWRVAAVGDGRSRDTLSLGVKTTHFGGLLVVMVVVVVNGLTEVELVGRLLFPRWWKFRRCKFGKKCVWCVLVAD